LIIAKYGIAVYGFSDYEKLVKLFTDTATPAVCSFIWPPASCGKRSRLTTMRNDFDHIMASLTRAAIISF
jgi:hypothetical protein